MYDFNEKGEGGGIFAMLRSAGESVIFKKAMAFIPAEGAGEKTAVILRWMNMKPSA